LRWDWRDRIRRSRRSVNGADRLDYDGVPVIAFEDDASRTILSIGEFANATTGNAITAFKRAEELSMAYQGYIIAVNTDHGSQFYATRVAARKRGRA
jgi:hypothetical protein